MEIKTKAENYKLYHAGAFGNKPSTWNSYEEMMSSGNELPYAIRYKKPGSKWCIYSLLPFQRNKDGFYGPEVMEEWIKEGADPKLFEFSAMGTSDNYILIQGEIRRSENYYDFLYSTYLAPMRIALAKEPRYATGITAVRLISDNLDASSQDNLDKLFREYSDSIVEFSCYSKAVGELRWNTIFWEVRNY